MTNFKIKQVSCIEEINELANMSALTFEGLNPSKENLIRVAQWLDNHGALIDENLVFHVIKGKLMNDEFKLTGNNQYPDDLSIVSIMGIDISKIILARFEVDGRWLDDIIDNNVRREGQ